MPTLASPIPYSSIFFNYYDGARAALERVFLGDRPIPQVLRATGQDQAEHPPPEDGSSDRAHPDDAERARRRAAALTLPEVAAAVDALHEAGPEATVDPGELIRGIRDNDDVVDILLDSPGLRLALTDQPAVLLRLCRTPQAAAALRRALDIQAEDADLSPDLLVRIADGLRAHTDGSPR